MGKLPSLTGKQVIAAFGKIGYETHRIRGSHHILKHPQRTYLLTVPVHGTTSVARGMLRSLIRTAGLDVDEFCDLL